MTLQIPGCHEESSFRSAPMTGSTILTTVVACESPIPMERRFRAQILTVLLGGTLGRRIWLSHFCAVTASTFLGVRHFLAILRMKQRHFSLSSSRPYQAAFV